MNIPQLQSILKRNAGEISMHEKTMQNYKSMLKDGTIPKVFATNVYNRISTIRRKVSKLADIQVAIKKDIKLEQKYINQDKYANNLLDIMGIA